MDSNDGALAKQQISHQIQIQNNSFIKQRYFEIYLKELRNYKRKLFMYPPKK